MDQKWSFMANIGWQNWERFGKLDVSIVNDTNTTNVTADRNYQDTWHFALGAEARLLQEWLFTAGFAYDSSPVKDENRTLDFAVGKTYRYAIGTQWHVSEAVDLGFAYELAWVGDLPVDQQRLLPLPPNRVSGTYASSALHFFALSLEWDI
jgi:long-chain fatty acid transport protein